MVEFNPDSIEYPNLAQFVRPVKKPEREIIGRDREMEQILAAFNRPELANILLLSPAGGGKTSLVQGLSIRDTNRLYLEVDLARMIGGLNDTNELAALLKSLFDEVIEYNKTMGSEIVLFIDEFHQIVQLSDAAVEALKPLLADSSTRGIRVIVATTFVEFREHISANQPLVERLQRINLPEPDERLTVEILRGMANRYGVGGKIERHIYHNIYEYTQRYIPANSQPRKSILVLDAMIGWHGFDGSRLNDALLAKVIYEAEGVNVAFNVDATKIEDELNKRVLSQQLATHKVADRLHIAVAGLGDPSKPQGSFLFSGSTGVGKHLTSDTLVPVKPSEKNGWVHWKKHGDLEPGDEVFQRDGSAQEVLGVFPQKMMDIYRVHFSDGRYLDAGGKHLWGVYTSKMRNNKAAGKDVDFKVMSTLEMLNSGVTRKPYGNRVGGMKYFIPMNGAVQWPEVEFPVDPYVLGAFIGDGSLTSNTLTISGDDVDLIERISDILGFAFKEKTGSYGWVFLTGEMYGTLDKLVQTSDIIPDRLGLKNVYSKDRFIPEIYKQGSVDQRWELIRGLFDTDGSVEASYGRLRVSYSTFSKTLAKDISDVLFSLGVSNSIKNYVRERENEDGTVRVLDEYVVRVKTSHEKKLNFFWLPRKRQIVEDFLAEPDNRERVKKFDMIGIKSIEKLPEQQEAQCIYVSGEEHLYQAGNFVVTHNTELSKAMADILFKDKRALIRFDMTEYALDDSVERFRKELTTAVWEKPFSIVLFDEIEKASGVVTRILLQVLDDGRLIDQNQREVSFVNTYIVITTNAGSHIYRTIGRYASSDTGDGSEMRRYMKEIRRSLVTGSGDAGGMSKFPPELLGRIDELVPFQPLSEETMRKIVLTKIANLRNQILDRHGVHLDVDRRILDFIVYERSGHDDSDAGGARGAITALNKELVGPVSRFINENPRVRHIIADVEGELIRERKDKAESTARIVVGEAY